MDLPWIAQGLYLVLAHCIGEAVELVMALRAWGLRIG
jgi:hypothetical protein